MGKLFSYDSPIIQSINKIVDCVILSILWVLCSIPIITFGASTTALYYTVNKVIRHGRSHVWREFWRTFKGNFKQSTIVWMILLVLFYLLGVDCMFFYNFVRTGAVTKWILVLFGVMILFAVVWAIYVFAYIARFENSLKVIVKNSAFLVIRHLLRSLLLAVIFVATVVLFLFMPITIVFLPVLGMFLMTVILESIFEKYMSEEDLAKEAERNQIY